MLCSPQSYHSYFNREKHRKVADVSSFFSAIEIDNVRDLTQSEEGNRATDRPLHTTYTLIQHFKKKQQLLLIF